MRIRLLLAATAAITLAACSESSTAPQKLSPADRSSRDIGITCRSGYHIATRADGSEYCEGDSDASLRTTTTTTPTKK
jgi:hypothetical protein